MDLRNCPICGKVMQRGLRRICPSCAEKKEENFLKVRDYIKDNPKVSIEVVIEATGVSEVEVRQFLREGLIEAADLDGMPLTCTRCGKPIMNGLYCALCQQEFPAQTEEHEAGEKGLNKKKNKPSFILDYDEQE